MTVVRYATFVRHEGTWSIGPDPHLLIEARLLAYDMAVALQYAGRDPRWLTRTLVP